MADLCDLASDLEERERAAALGRLSRRTQSPVHDGLCIACGDAIEPRRAQTLPGTRHCAECAADLQGAR